LTKRVLVPRAPATPAAAFSSTTPTPAKGRAFAKALSTTASSSTKGFLRPGFINDQLTALDRLTIQFLNGFLDICAGNQFHKCETAGQSGIHISNQFYVINLILRSREEFFQASLCYAPGQIAHIKFCHIFFLDISE
jgi:hypothetical protein